MRFFVSDGVWVPTRLLTENNNQVNYGLFFKRKTAVELDKRIRTIKAEVRPEHYTCHSRTLNGIIGGIPSIKLKTWEEYFKKGKTTQW